jgi:hypothetical protein
MTKKSRGGAGDVRKWGTGAPKLRVRELYRYRKSGRSTVPVPCSVIVSANVARLKEAIESLLQPSPGGTGT